MPPSPPVTASLFFTCMADALYPNVAMAAATVLERFGVTVRVPPAQTCCGQPAFNSGHRKEARKMAAGFLRAFDGEGYIVTPSGSCAVMVKEMYPVLFRNEPRMLDLACAVGERVYELSQFLVDVLGVTDPKSAFKGKVTLHDSCHLLRGLGVREQPRTLLRAIPGVELVEMEQSDRCCGFGGVFSVKNPLVSCAMVDKKIERILATGAQYVASGDLGCLMNIGGAVSRSGYPVKPIHLAEILAGPPADGNAP
ncbi:MAG TPA: (Fe-S)-binding protein [Candidatus Deferrimicrobiaceae bacterium]|jgi:L-lactate dehydrogenase complex protein LldE